MGDYREKLKEIKEKIEKENKEKKDSTITEKPSKDEKSEKILSDEEIFEREMKGVRKIQGGSRIPKKKVPKLPSVFSEDADVINTLNMQIDEEIEFRINDTSDYIEGYNVRDYDPNGWKKLIKGEIAFESYLDLHGKTKDEAKSLVKNFIEQSRKSGHRCVLIIHGKGMHSKDYMPVLKEALKNWLSGKSTGRHIMAFCSAIQRDGGTGAIYVLLRK
ncbi:MAG: Smr/MutS family protein [Deltaproteobacteria bacterium]|nr:Smr/MutS family protein [Deltaproteobacteria bacterium]